MNLISFEQIVAALGEADISVTIADAQQPDLPLIYVNHAFEKLTGYQADEVLGKNCRFLQGQSDQTEARTIVRSAIKTHQPCDVEFTNHTKQGTPFQTRLQLIPIFENGSLRYYAGFQKDITKLRKAEYKLNETNLALLEKVEQLNVLSKSFEQAQEIAKLGHWILEMPSQKLIWSDEVFKIFGTAPQSFEPTYEAFIHYVHPNDRAELEREFQTSIDQKRGYDFKHRIIREDGEEGFVHERGFHYFDEQGELIRSVGTVNDITEQHRKDFEIASYVDLVNHQVIMSRTDLTGKITEVSDFFTEISGYQREELIGQSQNIVRHPDMPKRLFTQLWQTIQSEKTWTGDIKNLRKDGSAYWVRSRISPDYDHLGHWIGYISLRLDITAEKALEELAIKDEMTGLYNRRFYNQNLHQELERAREQEQWLCFLMIDADNFKKYNDTYGHQAGDAVIKHIADILKTLVPNDMGYAFRLGGEEFAALFEVSHRDEGLKMAQAINEAMQEKAIEHSGNAPWMQVTLSIGAMLMDPSKAYVEEEIYKYADEALYRAKSKGRNRVERVIEHDIELF
ncbi:sensor domain-containing diguanylate cyclase [Thiomicrospira sp. WB1]|uniref:sensor domain-containing diguanylate cyclase n=1 Tax=Thiomicrospira sp. WB1 TaxID=1685380 RepID=UPI0007497632|nr:sensor domain-containing diguanylate cyclase [Thiomicrospira sp. WB1]KUJ72614.1 hypothetical protein AVO41_02090 [Thiomicrospira sp. WB1]